MLKSYVFLLSICCTAVPAMAIADSYDPRSIDPKHVAEVSDVEVIDNTRNRIIPLRIYLPAQVDRHAVVLFSHGLGGSREGSSYLGRYWSAREYVVVFLQHPGSDESVWKGVPPAERMQALQKAASFDAYIQRVLDVPAVLDQLGRWNEQKGHVLEGRLDLEAIGMSGHSFGAVTTQAVSGQSGAGGRQPFTDKRIDAAVIMSPSTPRQLLAQKAFSNVQIPWLLMTGTHDTAPIGNQDMASRLAVFLALPTGSKYELVLDGAEHSVFTDRALPGDAKSRNPAHHPAILALSTAFWDAWLLKNKSAKKWLDGDGPRSVLVAEDRWQVK